MQLQQVARCPLPVASCKLLEWNRYILELQTVVGCRLLLLLLLLSLVGWQTGTLTLQSESKQKSTGPVRDWGRVWVAHQMHLSVGLLNLRPNKTDCQGFRFSGLHLPLPLWLRFWFWVCLYPLPLQSDRFQGPPWSRTGRQTERQRWRQIRMQLQLQLKAAQNCNFKNKVYAFQKEKEMATEWKRERVEKRKRAGENERLFKSIAQLRDFPSAVKVWNANAEAIFTLAFSVALFEAIPLLCPLHTPLCTAAPLFGHYVGGKVRFD